MSGYTPVVCDLCKEPLTRGNIEIEFWYQQATDRVVTIVEFITYHRSEYKSLAHHKIRNSIHKRVAGPYPTATFVETRRWLEAFRSLNHWEAEAYVRFTQLLNCLEDNNLFNLEINQVRRYTGRYEEDLNEWWKFVLDVGMSKFKDHTIVTYQHTKKSDRVLCMYPNMGGKSCSAIIDLNVVYRNYRYSDSFIEVVKIVKQKLGAYNHKTVSFRQAAQFYDNNIQHIYSKLIARLNASPTRQDLLTIFDGLLVAGSFSEETVTTLIDRYAPVAFKAKPKRM